MIAFTIRTTNDKQGGAGIEFDIKADPDSPSEIERLSLEPYLTPKSQKILLDYLEATRKRNRKASP